MSEYRIVHDKPGVIGHTSIVHKPGDIITFHIQRKLLAIQGKRAYPAHPAYVVLKVDDAARVIHVEPHDEALAELEAKIEERLPNTQEPKIGTCDCCDVEGAKLEYSAKLDQWLCGEDDTDCWSHLADLNN